MKKIYRSFGAFLLGWVVVLGGCSQSNSPRVDHYFGTSFQTARESQLAYPGAKAGLRPQTGMDGVVAKRSMMRYQDSFGDAEQPASNSNVNTGINVIVNNGSGESQ